MVKKFCWLKGCLTTDCDGVGVKPVSTASMPRTERVPVAAFGTDDFPAFYARASGLKVPRLDGLESLVALVRAQAALGWKARLEARIVEGFWVETVLTLSDADGAPIENAQVQATFERPTQLGNDFAIALRHEGQGRYQAAFELPLIGQWNVHVTARRDGTLFVHDERVILR